jgi:hypothetical protein
MTLRDALLIQYGSLIIKRGIKVTAVQNKERVTLYILKGK